MPGRRDVNLGPRVSFGEYASHDVVSPTSAGWLAGWPRPSAQSLTARGFCLLSLSRDALLDTVRNCSRGGRVVS